MINHALHTQEPSFRGFLTRLLSEAFYQEEIIPAHLTAPENINVYEEEDPCDRQQFIKSFLGKSL